MRLLWQAFVQAVEDSERRICRTALRGDLRICRSGAVPLRAAVPGEKWRAVPPVTSFLLWSRSSPRVRLTPGAGTLQGPFTVAFEHVDQFLRQPPGTPGGTTSQASAARREPSRTKERWRVEEVTDEPLYRDRVCGTGIGKAGMAATIRVPSDKDPGRRMQETRTFGTTRREVLALADWLRAWGVPAVVMEAASAPGRSSARRNCWNRRRYRRDRRGHDPLPHPRAPGLLGRPHPLDNSSGKRNGSAAHKKGNRYIAAITGETATAAGKTQTREGARYRRIARRRGKTKANVALGNTQMRVLHALLSQPGSRHQDLGPDYYERQRGTAARSASSSASSVPSATKSPSAAFPNPNQAGPPRRPNPYRNHRRPASRLRRRCRAPG